MSVASKGEILKYNLIHQQFPRLIRIVSATAGMDPAWRPSSQKKKFQADATVGFTAKMHPESTYGGIQPIRRWFTRLYLD